jgi:pyrroline-5-carboxylate reductase
MAQSYYTARGLESHSNPLREMSSAMFSKCTLMAQMLLHGLRVAKEIGVQHIMCCGDSNLLAQQVVGTYKARNEVMAAYRDEVHEMDKSFLGYDIKHVR